MWKQLRKQHDDGLPFKPRAEIKRKPGDLARLSESARFSGRSSPSRSLKRRLSKRGALDEEMGTSADESSEILDVSVNAEPVDV